MIEVRQTATFTKWLTALRDANGKAKIITRPRRVRAGNLGDANLFGGIGELRVDVGPGYRIYFVKRGDVVIVLLCGGDKSTQSRDIASAKSFAEEL